MPFCVRTFSTTLLAWHLAAAVLAQESKLPSFSWRVTGLFSRDREADLREVVKSFPNIQLEAVDFATAEARFRFDPATAFPGAKPEQILERLDNQIRHASRHTFGLKPLITLPREKLQFVEIRVAGLDCKACCLVAYEAIYKIDGVEQATASFRDGLVTAWIDPQKTDRAALEDALRKKRVPVVAP